MKRILAGLAAASVLTAGGTVSAQQNQQAAGAEQAAANPVISRGVPAFSGGGNAAYGNDDAYWTAWQSEAPDYLAYDLSGVPEAQRKQIIAVWYNDSTYDSIGSYVTKGAEPVDYVIEINRAAGGSFPDDGWETAASVTDNGLSSRQHLVALNGANWIRLRVTKAEDGKIKLNFDVHDASQGVFDSWIFLGDSITAGGMVNQWGTSFAAHINRLDSRFYPAAQNGGIGGIASPDGRAAIDGWLKDSPVRFVSIAYGTNDCWGNPDNADAYYENTKYMIDAVLALGKIPVLPTIPASANPDVQPNAVIFNRKVRQLYEEYGDRLVKGPDFEAFFTEHPEYLSGDGVHPSSDGYEAMRQFWAETMYETVYRNTAAEPPASIRTGDVDLDGAVSAADAVLLAEDLTCQTVLTPEQAGNADMNADGILNAGDLTLLKRSLIQNQTGGTNG